MSKGRVLYLMGPSGSGKDSLIDVARGDLERLGARVATRVITRSPEAVGEAAQTLSMADFLHEESRGAFAMSWKANGLAYGIPKVIDQWLEQGWHVLVNGSRQYLPEACRRYPGLLAILLEVEPQVLAQRLHRRGRETPEEIARRLERASLPVKDACCELYRLDNSRSLEACLEDFLAICAASGLQGNVDAIGDGAQHAEGAEPHQGDAQVAVALVETDAEQQHAQGDDGDHDIERVVHGRIPCEKHGAS